jgi:cell wall-associated NlpC family hydrolase
VIRQEVATGALPANDPSVWGAEVGYATARSTVAALAAPRAGVDAPGLDGAWAVASDQRMTAVLAALSQIGVPYRGYKAIPGYGFDCSGLTSYAWGVAGVSLPHQSSAQIAGATPHALDAVQPGDLVQYPGHVMLALGYGHAIVHAPHTGRVVEVESWHRARRAGSPVG